MKKSVVGAHYLQRVASETKDVIILKMLLDLTSRDNPIRGTYHERRALRSFIEGRIKNPNHPILTK